MPRHAFRAHLFHVGLHHGVVVPPDIIRSLGGGHFIDVRGTANGEPFTARLAPAAEGQHLLALDTGVRKRAGIDIGLAVDVELWADDEHHTPSRPTAAAHP